MSFLQTLRLVWKRLQGLGALRGKLQNLKKFKANDQIIYSAEKRHIKTFETRQKLPYRSVFPEYIFWRI